MSTRLFIPGLPVSVVVSEEQPEASASGGADGKTRAQKQHDHAWGLAYQALQPYVGEHPRILYGPHGKPYLADTPWVLFNLSHCPGASAVVIGLRKDLIDIGIDVERRFPWKEPLARHIAHQEEYAALMALPQKQRESALGSLWSYKESYLKQTGEGFSADPKAVRLWTPHAVSEHLTLTGNIRQSDDRVLFYEQQTKRHTMVVCVRCRPSGSDDVE